MIDSYRKKYMPNEPGYSNSVGNASKSTVSELEISLHLKLSSLMSVKEGLKGNVKEKGKIN